MGSMAESAQRVPGCVSAMPFRSSISLLVESQCSMGSGSTEPFRMAVQSDVSQVLTEIDGKVPRILARILYDPAKNETCAGGWNPFANQTIRRRVNESKERQLPR